MTISCSRALGAVSLAAGLFFSVPASADDSTSSGYAQKSTTAEYPTPLAQQTQPSYVPQSVALSGPSEIKNYNEGDPIPPGYTPVERVRKGAIIGGAVTFGSLYFLSALVAAVGADSSSGGKNEVAAMWIPAFGPFVQMFSTDSATAKLFLAMDGVGQSLGVALLIYGITTPKTILVRNDLSSRSENKPKVRAVPMMGQGTTGLSLVGTF